MKLNRTDAFWDRKTRNDLNENWDIIEGNTRKLEDDFKNVVNNITDDVVEQLVDNAKLNWKEPVPSQNNLPGNAQVGDTRMTRDTGKVYRFNGSAWVEIQQIDAGPVNEVDSRLTAQLADVANKSDDLFINVKHPPAPLNPAKIDGVTDDTHTLQEALDYVGALGGGTVFVPLGTLICSVLYIPDNVTLKGSGYGTVLKLMDDCPYVPNRKPTGIYPKQNVSFFGVMDLTYDGNALNNIDLDNITDETYNDYYAHGISNAYTDENTNTDNPGLSDPSRYAKDFTIERVHIKNVVRNCILIGGRERCKGTVNDVILENAYTDHFIYESYTDSLITYRDVKLRGCWRGAAIVAESGDFNEVKLTDVEQNPSPNLFLGGLVDIRGTYQSKIQAKPSLNNVTIDVPFSGLHFLFGTQSGKPPKGADFNKIVINQTDDVEVGRLGVALSVFLSYGNKNVRFSGVEVNNVVNVNLLAAYPGTRNISFDDVTINYSDDRPADTFSDALVSINNGIGSIEDISVKNVNIFDKAPSMLRYRKTASNDVTNVDSVRFENVKMKRSVRSGLIFDVVNAKAYFNSRRIRVIDSEWDNYLSIATEIRDEVGIDLVKSYHNGIPSSQNKIVGLPAGKTSVTVDFPYILTPRVAMAQPRYLRDPAVPSLTFSGLKLTITIQNPFSEYQEYMVFAEF